MTLPGLGRCTVAIVLCLAAARAGRAQFSPGALSKPHSSLAGPAHCTACHAFGTGERRFKCLGCHVEIRERLATRRGLHASLVHKSTTQVECVKCHSEHNGEAFVPILWDVDIHDFDHGRTGYPLEGAHKGLDCSRCHAPRFIAASEKRRILVKDLKRTYLGLSRQCAACHQDEHRGQLSSDCRQCHSMTRWKPAAGFDHMRAKFQLAGAHATVACAKCHKPMAEAGKTYIKFVGLQFQACAACHNDPHHGAFKGDCESCHSASAWKGLRVAALETQFDHSKTKFPLVGKHAGVPCAKCHQTSDFSRPVAHAKCVDCHNPNAHGGQFLARADGGECASCHVVEAWKPAHFTVADHRATHYPLEGRHAAVACAKCHAPAAERTNYRVRFDRCGACHGDTHEGQFAASPLGNRCDACHTVNGFRPSTFTLARHENTRFRLAGAHEAIVCMECHASKTGTAGHFRFADRSCEGCHADPHAGQFKASRAGCETCHNLRTWRDVARFDHASTRFALTGAHRAVACADCHRGVIRDVVFRAAPADCAQCHQDVHGGQFASGGGVTDCSRCHTSAEWKSPSRFNHDRDSDFLLTGAHRAVACSLCHTQRQAAGGKLIVMYKLAPRECSGCHGPQLVAKK